MSNHDETNDSLSKAEEGVANANAFRKRFSSIEGIPGLANPEFKSPEAAFAQLKELTGEYMSKEEEALLDSAFEFANKAHQGQLRKSGEPFIVHPIEVGIILSDLRMDVETICAAILHDTVEDTTVTSNVVEEKFGPEVRQLVDGVTKITRIEVGSLTDEQAATIRKMLVAMSKDIRVIVIKLADRLHNMRTLSSLKEDRRIFKARETLEIYAPIAHRLGINSIKWELEDLSFFYLEPNKYKQVSRMVTETREEREEYLQEVVTTIEDEMNRVGVKAKVTGRPKHLYSIYQKMSKKGKGFSEIYDLIAVRVIVDSVKDCYSALGAVHTLWRPMPGRFKDYIAMPKYNMYQSLHTTVMGPAGKPLEVQIRTENMHRASEYGVAAHWRYKEGKKVDSGELDKQLAWLREMIDWQDDTEDSREFLKSLKMDLDNVEIYVFTPNGDVKTLRAGATPIDFAYTIHTEIGNHCVGAKVNGAIVPLTYELHTGDRVEVLTSKNASPSRDWLGLVKTPSARSKIRNYFSKKSRSTDIADGHDILMREMRKHGVGLSNARSGRALKIVADAMGFNGPDDMFVQLAKGNESAQHVANRLLKILVDRGTEEAQKPKIGQGDNSTGVMPPLLTSVKRPKNHETHSSNGVIVKGLDDILVRLSRCCNPVPGDEIMGFVTRGRGVSVHRADCPNATDLMKNPERIIEVAWEGTPSSSVLYKVEVYIEALDRINLLLDVTQVFSESGANVLSCTTNTHKDGVVEMRFLFEVSDFSNIDFIIARISELDGVFDARRLLPGEASTDGSVKK